MARNELNREDLAVLAVVFGFDSARDFEEFANWQQVKDEMRQFNTQQTFRTGADLVE